MNCPAMRNRLSPTRQIILAITFVLAACSAKEPLENAPLAGASIGGDFTLQDKAGKPVSWSDFKGKWRIVYFGYTFCPDACPTDLGVLTKGFSAFAKADPALASGVQLLFITIDPERDTPARVGEFAAYFSPTMIGLTGKPDAIDRAAKAFAIYHARGKDMPGGYIMDHSRIAYLFDTGGKPITMLPIDKGADAVSEELTKWVR